MKKCKSGNRGIVLITTLLLTGLMVMFASAILVSVMRQQLVVSRYYEKEAALQAAHAGINYALMRLNSDTTWKGYGQDVSGDDYSLTMTNEDGETELQVKEHEIGGSGSGCVEGKIKMGEHTGYFDIYFVDPSSAASSMEYFGSDDTEAGEIPEWIPICLNNNDNPNSASTEYYDADDGVQIYKDIPAKSILLACRGKVGSESKIIETCVSITVGEDYDSVAIGRGDIKIHVGEHGKISLKTGPQNKPPIMRSNGNIEISKDTPGLYKDYVSVEGDGAGYAMNTVVFDPTPTNNSDKFQSNAGDQQEAIPPLEMSKLQPETDDFIKIPAGVYKIEPNEASPLIPKVTYYATNDPDNIYDSEDNPDGIEGAQSSFITNLINSGAASWDNDKCILSLNESLTVDKETNITNLAFISNDIDRIVISLNSTVDPETLELNTVYLVNENESNPTSGSIIVEGELSGVGTVLCKGDLEMEARSQLAAAEETGISIYSGGNININEIQTMPKNAEGLDAFSADDYTSAQIVINYLEGEKAAGNFPGTSGYYIDGMTNYSPIDFDKDSDIDQTDGECWNLLKEIGVVSKTQQGWEYLKLNNGTLNKIKSAQSVGLKYVEDGDAGRGEDDGEDDEDDASPFDSVFRGLVFACKNFNVDSENTAFKLEGGLVAYGGTPGGDTDPETGIININADEVEFIYDTRYLSILQELGENKIETLYWGSY